MAAKTATKSTDPARAEGGNVERDKPTPGMPRRTGVLLLVLVGLVICAPWLWKSVAQSSETETHLYRGSEYLHQGQPALAEQEWLTAARLTPGNPNVHKALGTLYTAQGRWPRAHDALNRLADLSPKEPHVLCELAEAEVRAHTTQSLEYAVPDATRAAELEPDCTRAQTLAGNLWLEKGDQKKGLVYLRRAAALNPADVSLTLHLINSLLEANDLPEALPLTRALTRRYPAFAQGYALLGMLYQLSPPGSPEAKSVPDVLIQALHLDPTNALAQALMGHFYLNAGQPAKAIGYLESAQLLDYQKTSVLFDLIRAYRSVGRTAEAARLQAAFERQSKLEAEVSALQKRLVVEPDDKETRRRYTEVNTALHKLLREQQARLLNAPTPPKRPPSYLFGGVPE